MIDATNMNIKDIVNVQLMLSNKEDPFTDKHPEGWEHGVILRTKKWTYHLFAKDYNFREQFVYLINYAKKEKSEHRPPGILKCQKTDENRKYRTQS